MSTQNTPQQRELLASHASGQCDGSHATSAAVLLLDEDGTYLESHECGPRDPEIDRILLRLLEVVNSQSYTVYWTRRATLVEQVSLPDGSRLALLADYRTRTTGKLESGYVRHAIRKKFESLARRLAAH